MLMDTMSFVNAVKDALSKHAPPPPAEKFVFIICMNNSGSTLLERVLSECRNAVGLPAPGGPDQQVNGQRFVKEYMPSPGRMPLKCRRIWSEQAAILQVRRPIHRERHLYLALCAQRAKHLFRRLGLPQQDKRLVVPFSPGREHS